jgi:hypothetical protein
MYWGTSWKENSYLNIVLWLEESMEVQWISPSVRTGRINEVCGNPPQKIGGMGIGPTATRLVDALRLRFSTRVRKCELATQTSGNPIGMVDAILMPIKERWGHKEIAID